MSYSDEVLAFRRRKDEHFAAGRGPLKAEQLPKFQGLTYYPPDISWRFLLPLEVPGEMISSAGTDEIALATNTGAVRYMAKVGEVQLPLPTGDHTLSLFAPLGEEQPARVFVPFRDTTSGNETYGAGRYLDAPLHREGEQVWAELDFNLAYHPYCAYGEGWTCPLPPASNVLPLAVRAGEKWPEN